MEERNNNNNNDGEKVGDEVMLPGFRFHPTDEELVGFYLRRKIQQRPLSIELIKQLDIYKYDPWDLPKLASTGEKEWYFYCPRDRKYRNSARPNRVTGAGFWKATGTDRPIYSSSSSSEGSSNSSSSSKCIIGLKKSLVFYKGRAAKGVKTDWMMHEFRLPSHSSSSSLLSQNKYLDNTVIPPNESWTICRIFKKTNSTAQRALSQSWVSSILPTAEPTTPDHNNNNNIQTKDNNPQEIINTQFCSSTTNNIIPLTKNPNCCLHVSNHFCPLDVTAAASYKSIINPLIYYKALDHFYLPFSSSNGGDHNNSSDSFIFSSSDNDSSTTNTNFGGLSQIGIHQFYDDANNDAMVKLNNNNLNVNNNNNVHGGVDEQDLETLRSFGFPFGVPLNIAGDAWKSNYNNVHWDASSCPSYSTTKCYT